MSNVNINRINALIPEPDFMLMKNNAALSISKIPPNATLTAAERNEPGKDIDGDKKIFVEDALTELNINGAEIMPAWLNFSTIQTDFTFFEQADELMAIYTDLLNRLSDAKRIAGREAYDKALKAYGEYKRAAQAGVPGAQASYDKLKVHFQKMSNSQKKLNP